MLLPWMSRSGPSLAFRCATASAGSPPRRWLFFHVRGRSDDVTTCFRTALNVAPIGWSPLGPVSGEDLIGSPAKQQLIAAAQQPPHRLVQRVVEIGEHPAAVRKAGLVLLRPAWCLDHAVERLEKGADDPTHRRLLRAPQPRSAQ